MWVFNGNLMRDKNNLEFCFYVCIIRDMNTYIFIDKVIYKGEDMATKLNELGAVLDQVRALQEQAQEKKNEAFGELTGKITELNDAIAANQAASEILQAQLADQALDADTQAKLDAVVATAEAVAANAQALADIIPNQ